MANAARNVYWSELVIMRSVIPLVETRGDGGKLDPNLKWQRDADERQNRTCLPLPFQRDLNCVTSLQFSNQVYYLK